MLTARAQGSRVEDLSQRTELTSTWANPDGTWTTDGHTGIQRFRGQDGAWVDVDLDLDTSAGGGVAPGGHPLGLRLPGAGRGGAISVDEGKGRTASLGVPGLLPAPELDGTRATYRGVTPGVDMVVEALRSGYEQFFVLHERPTGPVSWELPLLTKGLTARAAKGGGVEFVDTKQRVISRIPAAIAWDDRVDDATGDAANTSKVTLAVTQKNPGKATLTVTPDAAWLADPATVYPSAPGVRYSTGLRSVPKRTAYGRYAARPAYASLSGSLRTSRGLRNLGYQGGSAAWIRYGW